MNKSAVTGSQTQGSKTTTRPHNPLYIEDCVGWWLSGCCGLEAEHRRLKLEVSWVRLTAIAVFFFHFPHQNVYQYEHKHQ